MSESILFPVREQKYVVLLRWGQAGQLYLAIEQQLHRLLGQPLAAAHALALRPLDRLARRLAVRSWREHLASGHQKRADWKCTVSFDELVAVVEQLRPAAHDAHHAAFMQFHQQAVQLEPAIYFTK